MKLTFISDTHGTEPELPGGDILFHTGDFSEHGFRSEIIRQLNYLHEQLDKYKHVVVIPGNHDFWAERHTAEFKKACQSGNIIALIDEGIEIDGLKIYGSPATPWFHNWAFNYQIQDIIKVWDKIPPNLDVLLTHGPPYQILDFTMFMSHPGCVALRDKVLEAKPQIHAFGHIHEAAGAVKTVDTLFINSAADVIDVEWDFSARQFSK